MEEIYDFRKFLYFLLLNNNNSNDLTNYNIELYDINEYLMIRLIINNLYVLIFHLAIGWCSTTFEINILNNFIMIMKIVNKKLEELTIEDIMDNLMNMFYTLFYFEYKRNINYVFNEEKYKNRFNKCFDNYIKIGDQMYNSDNKDILKLIFESKNKTNIYIVDKNINDIETNDLIVDNNKFN